MDSYVHGTVSVCVGTRVQSEPCHMRGLAMYKRLSRENPHRISFIFQTKHANHTLCLLSGSKKHCGVYLLISLGCIGQLAVGLPGGAQHGLSRLMIAPCQDGRGAEQIRMSASEAD